MNGEVLGGEVLGREVKVSPAFWNAQWIWTIAVFQGDWGKGSGPLRFHEQFHLPSVEGSVLRGHASRRLPWIWAWKSATLGCVLWAELSAFFFSCCTTESFTDAISIISKPVF